MFKTLKNAWKVADLKKRILFTLFAIMIFRLGSAVAVPFVDLVALESIFASNFEGTLLGYMDILSGGGLSTANVFALGISPYINASIIIQLLTVAIPALERLAKEGGEVGSKTIQKITKYTALGLAFLQGFGYYTLLKSDQMNNLVQDNSFLSGLVIVLTFAAGTSFVMWLGDRITEKGIGNGTSIIIFSGIVASLPSMCSSIYQLISIPVMQLYYNITDAEYIVGAENISTYVRYGILGLAAILIFVFIIGFVVVMNSAERRIPVNYAKKVVGRKTMGGQKSHLPIKVSASGVMPIIFASSIVSLPGTIAIFFGGIPSDATGFLSVINSITQQNSPVYIVMFFLFIIGFSYFYAAMQFNPIEIGNNLKKNGGYIPGLRAGKPTTDFITKVLSKITFIGSMFLGFLATLPLVLGAIFPELSGLALGGTSIVIMVGVALEVMRQIESQMMMKHYKGFLE